MKIETEPRDDRQVRVVAEFEPAEYEKYKQQAARKISREAKIPGFRPGKAPYSVILRMFGEKAVQEQAIELMVDAEYPKILDQAELKPGYAGSLDEVVSLDPPKFAFLVPLPPSVELGDYPSIRKEYAPDPVSEEEVDDFIKRLQTSYSTAEPVERPAQEGDLVAIKISGTLANPEEDQEAELIQEQNYQVAIGNTTLSPDTWPFPGFSKELVGLSANEEKDIPYTYPEDHESEKLRGKQIVFHVAVQSVKALHTPELNDEFAQTVGQFDTLEDLRALLRKNLEGTKREEYDRKYFDEIMDEIVNGAKIEYPPQTMEEEEHQVLHSIEHNLADQGLELATYLKMINTDMETFMESDVRPTARRRIARGLVMDELARKEDLKLENADLQQAFNETFADLQQSNELQEMQKRLTQKQLSDAIAYEAAGRAMNRRLLRRLKSIATGLPEETPAVEEEAETESEETETASEAAAETAPVAETQQAAENSAADAASTEETPPADEPQA